MREPLTVSSSKYLHGAEPAKLLAWWAALDADRGMRARLRRIDRPDDVLLTDAFFNFLKYVPQHWSESNHLYASALVASILSQIGKNDSSRSFAAQLGAEVGGRPVMSELRFKQLLKSRTPEEFFKRILRAVRLLKGTANILSVADGILRWYDEYQYGPERNPVNRLSVKWAQEYYIQSNK